MKLLNYNVNDRQGNNEMSGDYLSVFNATNGYLSDAQILSAIADLQAQMANEFPWFWGNYAYIDLGGYGTPIVVTDYPGAGDPGGALGYHYIDGNYQPYARIFAALSQDYGVPWSGVLSHECLELAADQLIDTTNLYDNGDGTGFIVLQEVCDPCEALYYTGAVNGNAMSDFVTPAWYVPGDPNQVDVLGLIAGPWQLAAGGYVSYQYVQLGGWQQATADKVAALADGLRQQIATRGNPPAQLIKQLQRAAQIGQGGGQVPIIGGGPRQQQGGQQRQGQPPRGQQAGQGGQQRQGQQTGGQQPQQGQALRQNQGQGQRRGQGGGNTTLPVGPKVQNKPAKAVQILDAPEELAAIAASSQASRVMGGEGQQTGGRQNGSD